MADAADGAAHISSGDLLRAEVACGSGLGRQVAAYTTRGDLVPDELIFSILMPAVVAAARDTGGYVLDGFPRTMPQRGARPNSAWSSPWPAMR